jgi:hypothetical protein
MTNHTLALIRSSNFAIFHAGFCTFSAHERWLPGALRRAPVNAFDQHRKLCRRERHGAAGLAQRGPDEPALLQSLGEETQPVAVPEQNLDRVATTMRSIESRPASLKASMTRSMSLTIAPSSWIYRVADHLC